MIKTTTSANKAAILCQSKDISVKLGAKGEEVHVLRDINLAIHQGEKIAIVGPSGSGKTTLMMIMAGLMQPDSGQLQFQDQLVNEMTEDELALFRQQHIGIVFQNFHLIPSLTALQNVAFPLELAGNSKAEDQAREWLSKVGLSARFDHMPSQLSGGEQQRVALARALITRPSLILADEPTGNLDSENGRLITELLFTMVAEHKTALVLITHDQALAAKTDRTLHLVDGKIVA